MNVNNLPSYGDENVVPHTLRVSQGSKRLKRGYECSTAKSRAGRRGKRGESARATEATPFEAITNGVVARRARNGETSATSSNGLRPADHHPAPPTPRRRRPVQSDAASPVVEGRLTPRPPRDAAVSRPTRPTRARRPTPPERAVREAWAENAPLEPAPPAATPRGHYARRRYADEKNAASQTEGLVCLDVELLSHGVENLKLECELKDCQIRQLRMKCENAKMDYTCGICCQIVDAEEWMLEDAEDAEDAENAPLRKRKWVALVPCGHQVCDECGDRLSHCPACRERVVCTITTYRITP